MVIKKDNRSFVSLQHGMEQAEPRDIEAPGPKGTLAGTLLLPSIGKPPYDTVLILPGSGPIDRNGSRHEPRYIHESSIADRTGRPGRGSGVRR